MKRLLFISIVVLCLSSAAGFGQQTDPVEDRRLIKESSRYLSPYIPVTSWVYRYKVNTSASFPDSVRQEAMEIFFSWEGGDHELVYDKTKKSLNIIVDTTTELSDSLYFGESYWYDSAYASPSYLTLISRTGEEETAWLDSDRHINCIMQPVYIINKGEKLTGISTSNGRIWAIQEVMNKDGKWIEIENDYTGAGCRIRSCRPLFPGDTLVCGIIKYKGDFSTLGRLRISSQDFDYYSQIYTISVNAKILEPKRTVLIDGSLFEYPDDCSLPDAPATRRM